jgi:hypothetical protein
MEKSATEPQKPKPVQQYHPVIETHLYHFPPFFRSGSNAPKMGYMHIHAM